jgi:putative endonuclease
MSCDVRHSLGRLGERLAAEHLERRGVAIVDRNYRTRWGELDLVGLDGDTLVFCEVKTRRGGWAAPFDALSCSKCERVRRMAMTWLAEVGDRPHARVLRFDAIGVVIDGHGKLVRLDHVENAF